MGGRGGHRWVISLDLIAEDVGNKTHVNFPDLFLNSSGRNKKIMKIDRGRWSLGESIELGKENRIISCEVFELLSDLSSSRAGSSLRLSFTHSFGFGYGLFG